MIYLTCPYLNLGAAYQDEEVGCLISCAKKGEADKPFLHFYLVFDQPLLIIFSSGTNLEQSPCSVSRISVLWISKLGHFPAFWMVASWMLHTAGCWGDIKTVELAFKASWTNAVWTRLCNQEVWPAEPAIVRVAHLCCFDARFVVLPRAFSCAYTRSGKISSQQAVYLLDFHS